jgi:hypothetical protein
LREKTIKLIKTWVDQQTNDELSKNWTRMNLSLGDAIAKIFFSCSRKTLYIWRELPKEFHYFENQLLLSPKLELRNFDSY